MDPFSVTVGVLPLGVLTTQAVQSSYGFYRNYSDAESSMRHARAQFEFLHANLENTSASNSKLAAAQNSFEAIVQDSNELRMRSNKRGRLRWAIKDKNRAASLITRYKETELSASYALQLEQYPVLLDMRFVQDCWACILSIKLLTHFKKRGTRQSCNDKPAAKAAGGGSRVEFLPS